MTTTEHERLLMQLVEQVGSMREDIAALSERISALFELRSVNGRLYHSQLASLEERCDERHGDVVRRLESLEREERVTYGWRQKLAGMAAPTAIFVSIIALVLGVIR